MTATGALIARHVTDLFPTQTSRFDLAQAARRGVIAPLRCIRIPPGPGVRTIAKVPLRKRRGRRRVRPGDAGRAARPGAVQHGDRRPLQDALQRRARASSTPPACATPTTSPRPSAREGIKAAGRLGRDAQARAGRDPRRATSAARSTCSSTRSCSPRAGTRRARRSACTSRRPPRGASTSSASAASRAATRARRRASSSTSSIPATKHDDPVVTLHSLLDRDVYRGGAIVVGPVRRGRGRRVRVERRVIPVAAEEERRHEVFERELWRIAVEHLDYGEQHMWAALAGARVAPSGWRRARAMLHFDRTGELKRRFLLTAVERNKNAQLRMRALQEIAALKDAEAFDLAIDVVGTWAREERREGAKVHAAGARREAHRPPRPGQRLDLAPGRVHARGPRGVRGPALAGDQAPARPARQLQPARAHARNARRLVHAARKQDRRLQAALLAAAVAHTPEAEEVAARRAHAPGAQARRARRASCCATSPRARAAARRRRKKAAAAAGGRAGGAGAVADAGRARRGGARRRRRDDDGRRRRCVRQRRGARRAGEQATAARRRPAGEQSPQPGRARAARAGARTPTRRATRPMPSQQRRRPRLPPRASSTGDEQPRGERRRCRRARTQAQAAPRGDDASEGRRRPRAPHGTSEVADATSDARRRMARPRPARREAQAEAPPRAQGAGGQEGRRRRRRRSPADVAPPTLRRRRAQAAASARAHDGGSARLAEIATGTPRRRRRGRAPGSRTSPRAAARSGAWDRPRRRCTLARVAARRRSAQQVHLARAQRGAPAAGELHDQPPVAVDAGGRPAAAGPATSCPRSASRAR